MLPFAQPTLWRERWPLLVTSRRDAGDARDSSGQVLCGLWHNSFSASGQSRFSELGVRNQEPAER